MDAPKQYLEELRSEIGFYPTWLPGDPIELGDFGTFSRGMFRRAGRLSDLDIDFVTATRGEKNPFKKHRGMQFQLKSETKAELAPADFSLDVEMSANRAYAWAFGARGARATEIDNILSVATSVLTQYRVGIWKLEWLLVTELQTVDVLNVVIARSKDVKGKVVANVKADGLAPDDVLVAESASYSFHANDVFLVENARNTTPLFGLRALRGLFKKGLKPIAGGFVGDAPEDLRLERTGNEPMFPDEGSLQKKLPEGKEAG